VTLFLLLVALRVKCGIYSIKLKAELAKIVTKSTVFFDNLSDLEITFSGGRVLEGFKRAD